MIVAFDLDGTLIDSVGPTHKALVDALLSSGLAAPSLEEFRLEMGHDLIGILQRRGISKDQIEVIVRNYQVEITKQLESMSIYPGVLAMLRELRITVDQPCIAIITNRVQRIAEALLVQTGIRSHVHEVIGAKEQSDHSDLAKDSKQGRFESWYTAAVRVWGPQACLVGDRAEDALVAAKASIPFIRAGWGYGSDLEFAPYAAVQTVVQPAGLVEVLRKEADQNRNR